MSVEIDVNAHLDNLTRLSLAEHNIDTHRRRIDEVNEKLNSLQETQAKLLQTSIKIMYACYGAIGFMFADKLGILNIIKALV